MLILFLFTLQGFCQNTILVLGDSLSAGYGINREEGWVSLLQKRLQDQKYFYQVINASISGDTTSNGISRLPAAISAYHPVITIIELGGNDALRGLPISLIQKNLETLIDIAKNSGSKVLVLGLRIPPNYGAIYTDSFQQIFLNLSKRQDISVVLLFLKDIDDNPALMQSDQIHPTKEAQSIILNNVWPGLKTLLSR